VKTQQRVCPNELGIAAKVIDGEAIIIRLSDGMYFSLNATGSEVWELIERRLPLGTIHAALLERYEANEQEVRDDVTRLAEELLQENLVVVDEGSAAVIELPPVQKRKPYEPPRLHKYEDMADLLALDPPAPGLANIAWKDPSINE
jgi:hypothetical protein